MSEGSAGDTASTSVRAAREAGRDLFYRLLVENSRGFMCVHDLDGTLLYVNPEAAAMLGWRPEEGIGRSLREFLAPSVRYLFDE
jgi:PAS domain S-box-containing protein